MDDHTVSQAPTQRASRRVTRTPARFQDYADPDDVVSPETQSRKRKSLPASLKTRTDRVTKKRRRTAPDISLAQPATMDLTPTEPEGETAPDLVMMQEMRTLVDELQSIQRELQALKAAKQQQTKTKKRAPRTAAKASVPDATPDSDDGISKQPRAPRSRRRAMSERQKQQLHARICGLPPDRLRGLMDLVEKFCSEALVMTSPTDVEIDLSQLTSAKLWLLADYCDKVPSGSTTSAADAAVTPAETPAAVTQS